jgi:hypothetical protein
LGVRAPCCDPNDADRASASARALLPLPPCATPLRARAPTHAQADQTEQQRRLSVARLRRRDSDAASLPPYSPVAAARAARGALGNPPPAADGGADAMSDTTSTAPTDAGGGDSGGAQLHGRIQLLQARLRARAQGADSD